MTQRNVEGALVDQAELVRRAGCAARRARARSSPTCRRRRAASRPARRRSASSSCSERNLAIGERTSPASSRTMYARPFAPHSFANSSSSASSLRERRLRHAEEAHGLGAREDAELRAARRLGRVLDLEPEAQVGLVRAEAPVGLCVGHARERRLELDAEALAPDRGEHRPPSARTGTPRSGNDISTSSWVISCTRSARRSSSRKQIAIW